MIISQRPLFRHAVQLLVENSLPTSDLSPEDMELFLAIGDQDNLQGIVGVEIHGSDALLRSLAVSSLSRNHGYGTELVRAAEKLAKSNDIKCLYLITTTAQQFFERTGYKVIARSMVSDAIRKTEEFSSLCPADAVVMQKIF